MENTILSYVGLASVRKMASEKRRKEKYAERNERINYQLTKEAMKRAEERQITYII